ncbi:MAG: D-tyrosyl-tRNA(Tyr) deacylase [Candidatus Omnitrophica bacterium]|nr:D-tyrosyl-tRNA(Tyr) deacylase [Candidatus Omnitrophota bacterium]
MRAVIQRVNSAAVIVAGKETAKINKGLLVFLGVIKGDTPAEAESLANKIAQLRIFSDQNRKMNLSPQEAKAEIMVVSQFTLCADLERGRRPSFDDAAEPALAEELYLRFIECLKQAQLQVKQGIFKAYMTVKIENDGPVTFVLDT